MLLFSINLLNLFHLMQFVTCFQSSRGFPFFILFLTLSCFKFKIFFSFVVVKIVIFCCCYISTFFAKIVFVLLLTNFFTIHKIVFLLSWHRFLGHFQPQQGKPAPWELGSDQHYDVEKHGDDDARYLNTFFNPIKIFSCFKTWSFVWVCPTVTSSLPSFLYIHDLCTIGIEIQYNVGYISRHS